MRRTLLSCTLLASGAAMAQLYFPPNTPGVWETVDPVTLGWCTDQIPPLIDFLDSNDTKAFIVLKDGRIAIEQYFGTFTQDSLWYWASAGKSLTSFLVGMAQADGLLDINEPSSNYLGTGWTSCTPQQEAAITIRHQLTMTTGLDDGVANSDCTDPACLVYLADAGTRWAYHNAAYTKLDGVISAATGQSLNGYILTNLTPATGISGLYLPIDYNNVFFSTPRNMARFGLLALNRGVWNTTDVLGDDAYFEAMTTTSQTLNPSYGYLWWLNGKGSLMVPGSQIVFPTDLMPNEPEDAFNALGKNGQQINVVPSKGLVVVRMGNPPAGSGAAVAITFNNDMWGLLNTVLCEDAAVAEVREQDEPLFPVPTADELRLPASWGTITKATILSADGRSDQVPPSTTVIDVSSLAPGSYVLLAEDQRGVRRSARFVVQR